MASEYDTPRANIIKASRLLQAKAGSGSVDPEKIEQMQKIIEDSPVDFIPIAQPLLNELKQAITDAKNGKNASIDALIEPVMQIKANAGMFKYPLVGKLAGIVLDFLENIKTVDADVVDICDAHYKTLNLIISNHMTGDGGDYGQKLETELQDACTRYFNKQGLAKTRDPDSPDAFFVD